MAAILLNVAIPSVREFDESLIAQKLKLISRREFIAIEVTQESRSERPELTYLSTYHKRKTCKIFKRTVHVACLILTKTSEFMVI